MQKVEEEGEIVMVKEHRELDRTGTRKGHIVIKVKATLRLQGWRWRTSQICMLCVCKIVRVKCNNSWTGHSGASYHASGGGTLGGGPHLYRGLPVDVQDFPLQPHGCGQEAPGVVPRPKSQGQGTLEKQYHNNGPREVWLLSQSPYSRKVLGLIRPLDFWPFVFSPYLHGFCTETSFSPHITQQSKIKQSRLMGDSKLPFDLNGWAARLCALQLTDKLS